MLLLIFATLSSGVRARAREGFKNVGETRFVRGLHASDASSGYQSLQLNCMNIISSEEIQGRLLILPPLEKF